MPHERSRLRWGRLFPDSYFRDSLKLPFVQPRLMPTSYVLLDHLLFLVLAVVSPAADYFWLYPRLIRQTRAGVPGARRRAYTTSILMQWMLTLCVSVLWVQRRRPWSALWLGETSASRLAAGLALAAAFIGVLLLQRRTVLAHPEHLDKVRHQLAAASALLPHTPEEHTWFMLLSITAGICEEFLFRGFVLWYVRVSTGLLLAAAFSTILFGTAHLYLSRRDALRAGIVGAIMAAIVIATRCLLPAMVLHAAVDINSGDLAFHALRGVEP